MQCLYNAIPMQYIFDLLVDAAMCQFVDGLTNLPIDQLVSCSIPVICEELQTESAI